MNKNKKISLIIWLVIIVALLGLGGYKIYRLNAPTPQISKIEALAKCLTAKGVKMYGAFWCEHCQKQKESFGGAWQYINYIECSNGDGTQKKECQEAGIQGYPTWEFADGARQSGEMNFEDLAKKAGCQY